MSLPHDAGYPSLTERLTPIEAGAYVISASFIGTAAVFALADGAVLFVTEEGELRVPAHQGSVNVAATGKNVLVTGGDDGKVLRFTGNDTPEPLGAAKGWIDALAIGADGAVAWSSGKTVFARDGKGEVKTFEAPSSARGLAFAPKGYQLAVSRYNGVSLWFPRVTGAPKELTWKGSHIDAMFSPDGRFVVTTMQENALHGWIVATGGHMRMSGYPGKVRSTAWTADGKWLATAGADAAILWPFQAKDGPMGKAPKELGIRPARVSRVAAHPKAGVVALGYEDGAALIVRISDGAEILARNPGDGGAVTALGWDGRGDRLAFGTEDGAAGVVALPEE
ncbi:WD40 repeat domain-containing protein [Chenggangzhangella methanolivorans]|uniref:WD40 repeat domain-containing protein n=1 Tax=Chenggangzhangella methanolivorans TaxID=1437009 RepID=A0A9E6UMG1_9HYPH|nr:WD40 repeat domain-containing protein [Chenggangzhangella methanolivorans]QZN99163.1 WD40 repeat domain-containing protein [Chenggangzhangella methanolivorans]